MMSYAICIATPGFSTMPNGDEPTTASIATAKDSFAATAREILADYPTADGGAFAYVYPADSWDGISYGDSLLGMLEFGPRMGVTFTQA